MKTKFINAYMDVAHRFAELSSARRKKVGCIIVQNDRIVSIGYNGMPAGWDNDCEFWRPLDGTNHEVHEDDKNVYGTYYTRPEVLHAETNALAKLARSNESGDGATMFITAPPCHDCAKLIYQSGIKTVIYTGDYRTDDGLKFLEKCKVRTVKI